MPVRRTCLAMRTDPNAELTENWAGKELVLAEVEVGVVGLALEVVVVGEMSIVGAFAGLGHPTSLNSEEWESFGGSWLQRLSSVQRGLLGEVDVAEGLEVTEVSQQEEVAMWVLRQRVVSGFRLGKLVADVQLTVLIGTT